MKIPFFQCTFCFFEKRGMRCELTDHCHAVCPECGAMVPIHMGGGVSLGRIEVDHATFRDRAYNGTGNGFPVKLRLSAMFDKHRQQTEMSESITKKEKRREVEKQKKKEFEARFRKSQNL